MFQARIIRQASDLAAKADDTAPPAPDVTGGHDRLDAVAQGTGQMSIGIVELAGFLDTLEGSAQEQSAMMADMQGALRRMVRDLDAAGAKVDIMSQSSSDTRNLVLRSVDFVRDSGQSSQLVAGWVADVGGRMANFMTALDRVDRSLNQIGQVAREIQMLAINAKIEAYRAGETGRGFAVIADAIGKLSTDSGATTKAAFENIRALKEEAVVLSDGAQGMHDSATAVISGAAEINATLGTMSSEVAGLGDLAVQVGGEVAHLRETTAQFLPRIDVLEEGSKGTTNEIHRLATRARDLTDTSEMMVQQIAAMGGETADKPFIDRVIADAARLSAKLDLAVDTGAIRLADLFDQTYHPIPNTNPQQVQTAFTALCDQLFPAIQEPALALSPKVVFCAAVDRNGYLPTHNNKFSKPQGQDVTWNTANSRNRRIFDDRVGLKSGQSQDPFLLQVYRRDMGGGQFQMMKNLSAPIWVKGRHWGGLRLAYST